MDNNTLLDLLLFHANDKAKMATQLEEQFRMGEAKRHYYLGQYQAYNEMYSLINNLKENLLK